MSDSRQATDVRLDLTAVRGWLDLLHGTSPGLISIVSTLNWGGEFFDLSTQADNAAAYVRALDNQGAQGIYLRTTTLGAVPEKDENGRTRRGSVEESLSLPGFAGDIDIAGPGHKTKNLLPPDVPTAMSIVREAGLPEPTLWVHSGGGIYPWWLLDEAMDISMASREPAQKLANDIQQVLKRSAARLGWHYGGEVGELARVLRIPGTVNRKEGLARPCEVLEPASYEFYSFIDLRRAVREALEAFPEDKPVPVREPARPITTGSDLKPGEEYELRNDWADVLQGHFDYVCHRGQARMWLRVGSTSGARWSATSGRASDRDRLYLFTSEVPGLEANQPYTKFAVYAFLNHNGDFKSATKALAALGYGQRRLSSTPMVAQPQSQVPTQRTEPAVSTEVVVPIQGDLVASAPIDPTSTVYARAMSHLGVADKARGAEGQNFRYNTEQKSWYVFEGEAWERDFTFAIDRAVDAVACEIVERGHELRQVDTKAGQKMMDFGVSCRNDANAKSIIARLATLPGMSVRDSTFDAHPHLVTVANGVLNLETGELGPFDRDLMLTRRVPAAFDPSATAPRFKQFISQLIPDRELRDYVQRAMGYTLAGKVDHRAIFLLYGPPKTGKSQFLKLMGMIFGSFGGTAASDTLRVTQSTQSNNLHGLKGKRFVSTSETSVDTKLDEELIKRLTGGDSIVSRDLYEKNQEWQPECTIFMATNALPKLSVDDSAIWTRVKPIPFFTQFSTNGAHKEIHNIAKVLFDAEASGILNWLLEGLVAFEAQGLGEPDAVTTSVAEHRRESNTVATFIADALDEVLLIEAPNESISSSLLYAIYQNWSSRQGMRPVGMRRFTERMRLLDDGKYPRVKNSVWHWGGLKVGASGMMGTM
jgi:putative DNA primase/helicase